MRMTAREYQELIVKLPVQKKQKYNAKKVEFDDILFDSRAELEMYRMLCADPGNVDIHVHVPVTLPGEITLSVDFIVFKKDGRVKAIEVKGFETRDFKTKRKLFNKFHEWAPLEVWRKTRKGWEAI